MNGPLFILLVRWGVPASIATAIVVALAAFLGGCQGEAITLTRAPNTVTVPTAVVAVPPPQVVVPTANVGVPQK